MAISPFYQLKLVVLFMFEGLCIMKLMIIYGIIVLTVSIPFLAIAVLLMLGKANLIHSYHQENVKDEDKKKISLLIGIALLIASLGMMTSSIMALILKESISPYIYLAILGASLLISIVFILIVIKKYNGKIFS